MPYGLELFRKLSSRPMQTGNFSSKKVQSENDNNKMALIAFGCHGNASSPTPARYCGSFHNIRCSRRSHIHFYCFMGCSGKHRNMHLILCIDMTSLLGLEGRMSVL